MDLNSCLVNLCNGFMTYNTCDAKIRGGFLIKDEYYWLGTAIYSGHIDLVKYYSSLGSYSNTCMIKAVKAGYLHIVNFFIKKGANNWNWGMYEAVVNNRLDMVKFFIEKGAYNLTEGLTVAVKCGHKEIEEFLRSLIS